MGGNERDGVEDGRGSDHDAVLHCQTPDFQRLEELRCVRAVGLRVGGCAGWRVLDGRVVADAGGGLVADVVLFGVFVVGAFDGMVDELAVLRCHLLRRFLRSGMFFVEIMERKSFWAVEGEGKL